MDSALVSEASDVSSILAGSTIANQRNDPQRIELI